MKKNLLRSVSLLLALALFTSAAVSGTGVRLLGGAPAAAVLASAGKGAATPAVTVEEAEKALLAPAEATPAGAKKTADDGCLTDCGGQCGHCPAIVIHGIGQSEVYALDDNGNRILDKDGKEVTAWPPYVDMDYVTQSLAAPLVKSVLLQRDAGLSDKAAEVINTVFAPLSTGPDGNAINNIELVRYPYSVARCSEAEKRFIYSCMRLDFFTQEAGEDHLYYFAYNSFGNNLSTAEELYQYIQQVKRETGHDKVNLVPVSLGGTIANSLLEYYPQVYDDLNRVVFIVPALDGSNIIGDVYTGNLSLDDQSLYRDMFPSFIDGYLGYLINILLRLLPKNVIHAILDKALPALTQNVLVNCTVMWSLVPDAYYSKAVEMHLSGPEHAEIKRQTDLYHQAQLDSDENIQKLIDRGIGVFDIVDYNYPLYMIAGSWDECNSDGVIPLDSTSMGSTSALPDTPLPDDYTQQNTHCSNPAHNHMSPERIVDASTGLLPDHTWYFKNQHHEGTGRNDVIIMLATELLLSNDITSVYSCPDRYPQFNVGREARGFWGDIAQAKGVDQSTLAPEDAAELQAAIEQAEAMMNNTVVDYDAYEAARARLFAILIKIGVRNPPADTRKEETYLVICKFLSDALYEYWGPRGFSDWGLR